MNDGSQFIDIILFAMVAVFLGLRLRSVLGRRTGTEKPPFSAGSPRDNVVEMPRRAPLSPTEVVLPPEPGSLAAALADIHGADPSFTPELFAQGARGAFEMIVRAFAQGDEGALRPLLADAVFANFSQAIQARLAANETCANELVKIVSAEVVEARLEGRNATVGVRFVSQQIILIKDAEGRIVEGDPSRVVQVIDLWSFARDTRSRDPNWLLVATSSLDA